MVNRRVDVAQRPQVQPVESTRDDQPQDGLGWEALDEIVGCWTAPNGDRYEVTEDWKVVKAAGHSHRWFGRHKGEHRFNLCWDEQAAHILWGFWFFDPVDLYNDADVIAWYNIPDECKEQAESVWHRAEAVAERAGVPKESEEFTLERAGGGLEVRVGQVLEVMQVLGDRLVLELADSSDCAAPLPASRQSAAPSDASGVASRRSIPNRRARQKTNRAEARRASGNDVLARLQGCWLGAQGESYELFEDWKCVKSSGDKVTPYKLQWDEENEVVLWGTSFMSDASDLNLAEEVDEITWYRQNDVEKARPVFCWTRP